MILAASSPSLIVTEITILVLAMSFVVLNRVVDGVQTALDPRIERS